MRCITIAEGAGGASELMVERHGGERGESDAEVREGAGAMTLEVKMSLAVQRIDSMRWRIGARCGPRPFSSVRPGAQDRGVEFGELRFEVFAAKVLIADQDQCLSWLAFAARNDLQAHELLADFRGGRRRCAWGGVDREQGMGAEPSEVASAIVRSDRENPSQRAIERARRRIARSNRSIAVCR
jgi:hypothetical protein